MAAVVFELQTRVFELEATVKQLEKDKNELYNDLEEQLFRRRRRNSFWSSVNELDGRLSRSEYQRHRLESQLNRVTAERDSYHEDNIQIRRVKHDSDAISKVQMKTNGALEREVEFYKDQCQRALDHRDSLALALEGFKKTNSELEEETVHLNEVLQMERRKCAENESQKEDALNRVKQLEMALVECERIPQMEAQIQTLSAHCKELEIEVQSTQKLAKVAEKELVRCTQEKEDFQRELEVLQKASPPSIKVVKVEDSNGVVAETGLTYSERIQELERELNKKEDLLVCKAAALNSAIDGKTKALQLAAEWEAKWNEANHASVERSKSSESADLLRKKKGLDGVNANSKGQARWSLFRRAKITEDAESDTIQEVDNLNNALDSIVELVPRLRLIQEFLKKAQQSDGCSKRESLTSLYQAQEAIKALQTELDNHKIEGQDLSGRSSVHVLIGKEAVGLAANSVQNLQKVLTDAVV